MGSLYLSALIPFIVTQILIVLLAGNSSSLLTMSGVFSEAIVLTAGQYGYELILGFVSEHETDPCLSVDILHNPCGHARGSDLEPCRP
jgi:hypothetical protein